MEWKTETFSMGANRFMAEMIFRYGGWVLLALSAIGVIGLVLGISVDLRLLALSLMVIFLIAPSILALFYYQYGLKKECWINRTEHSFVLTGEGIKALIPENREMLFPYSSLSRFKIGSNAVILSFREKGHGFLWIPAGSFSSNKEMEGFLKKLDAKIPE